MGSAVHRRRSGWTSGGRMASAEGGSVPNGVGWGMGRSVPSSLLRGLGERRELHQRGSGQAENGFWRILKATEPSFLYLYDKIWGEGTICISVPRSNFFWGEGLSPLPPFPRDLRPCCCLLTVNRGENCRKEIIILNLETSHFSVNLGKVLAKCFKSKLRPIVVPSRGSQTRSLRAPSHNSTVSVVRRRPRRLLRVRPTVTISSLSVTRRTRTEL